MDATISKQIRILSLVCTIFVVYRHAYTDQAFFSDGIVPSYMLYIRVFLSKITSLAVPTFFVISGIFFFRRSYLKTSSYIGMIKKKTRTLLTPFLLWNIMAGMALYVENPTLLGGNFFDGLTNLFLSRWYGPLWYVRDLMIWMLLYPIYGWIIMRRCNVVLMICLLLVYYYWVPVASNLMALEGLLFFLIGGFLSCREKLLQYIFPTKLILFFSIIWLVCSLIPDFLVSIWAYKVYVVIGIFLLWQTVKHGESLTNLILPLTQYSFLLYVTHIYVLKLIKDMVALSFYGNGVAALLTYLLSPLLTIFVLYFLGEKWKNYLPKSYTWALGGR